MIINEKNRRGEFGGPRREETLRKLSACVTTKTYGPSNRR